MIIRPANGEIFLFSHVQRQETKYTFRLLRVKSRRLFYADEHVTFLPFLKIKFLAQDKKPFLLDKGHRAKVNDQPLNRQSISYPGTLPSFF